MNNSLIVSSLNGRIGIRDMFQTKDFMPLDSGLTSSTSGLFINSISEVYLRPETIDQFLEFAEGFNVDPWLAGTNFGQAGGQFTIIEINGKDQAFVSLANSSEDNLNKDPETESTFWETFLSYRLKQYRESAIQEAVNEVTTVKQLASKTNVLKSYDRLFYMHSKPETLQIDTAFRCVNIIPNDINSLLLEINQIGLVADTAQTVTFYLYHSDSNDALQTFDVTIAAGDVNNFVWKDLIDGSGNTLTIQNPGSINSGGIYLLGFYEDDITGNIKSWEYNYYSPIPYGQPGHINYFIWRVLSPYYAFYPNTYQEVTNKPGIPDIGQYFDKGNYDEEIAFNFKISIKEDHTNLIVDNVDRFDKLVYYKWAILVLTDMMHTMRKNSKADKALEIEKILNKTTSTEGTTGKFTETTSKGIIAKYELELKSLKDDLVSLTTNNFGLVQTY